MTKEFKAKVRKAHKVYTNEDGVQMCEMEFSKYLEMEKALTHPTAEEVCKALSEYFKKTVYYTILDFDIDTGFVLQWYEKVRSVRDITIVSGTGNRLIFYRELPPDLVELVAKYYKGEIK